MRPFAEKTNRLNHERRATAETTRRELAETPCLHKRIEIMTKVQEHASAWNAGDTSRPPLCRARDGAPKQPARPERSGGRAHGPDQDMGGRMG